MIRLIAIAFVKGYQYFISPFKGYTCAHNALHQNGGCSSRVLAHIKDRPMTKWYLSYKQELSACRDAFEIIEKDRGKDKKRPSKKGECCKDIAGDIACDSIMPSNCDIGSCNIGPCD